MGKEDKKLNTEYSEELENLMNSRKNATIDVNKYHDYLSKNTQVTEYSGLDYAGNKTNFGQSKYDDKAISPDDLKQGNLEAIRADKQSWGAETANAIGGGLAKIPFSVIGNIASILDFEDYANTDKEIGNSITAWTEEIKGNIEGATKIYKSNDNTLGSREWWMNNAKGLIDSAGGFVLTGAGLGKGVQLLSQLTKGSKIVQTIGTVTNAAMLNQAESIPIAMKVYQDAITMGKSEEEAADAAAYSININRINIPLNLTSAFAFLRPIATTRQVAKDFSRKEILANLLKEGSQEYLEENINMISEKEAIRKATDGNKYSYNFDNTVNDVLSKEGFETGLVGFIGGAVQTAGTDLIGHLQKDAPSYDIDGNVRVDEFGEPIKISRITSQKERFKAQQKSLNNIELLSKGQNVATVKETLDKVKITSELLNDIQIASIANDEIKVEELKNKLLTNQALDAFKNGTTEQLIGMYKSIQRDPSSKDKLGDDFMIKASEAIKDIESLEKIYQQHQHLPQINEVFNNRSDYTYNLKEANRLKSAMFQAQSEQAKEIEITGYNTEDKINSLSTTKELKGIQDKFNQVKDNVIKLNEEFNKITTEKYTKKVVKEKETVAKEKQKEEDQTFEPEGNSDLEDAFNDDTEVVAPPTEVPKENTITVSADNSDEGRQMFPNTGHDESHPNKLRDEMAARGEVLSSKEVQDRINTLREKGVNDGLSIDAVPREVIDENGELVTLKSVRIKLGNEIIGYFRPDKYHTEQIQQLLATINIGDILDNAALKKLGFSLSISNGFVSSSNTAIPIGELDALVKTPSGEYIIFDQGTAKARSQHLAPTLITDATLVNDVDGLMNQMNLSRYVLKFIDKSGNAKFIPLQTATLSSDEVQEYLNGLINTSNEVAAKTITQAELDEQNKNVIEDVFISISKKQLKEPLEVSIDIAPKGAIRIRIFNYLSDGKLNNEPLFKEFINRNELPTDVSGFIASINSKLAYKNIQFKLSEESFRKSVPKATTLKDTKQIESLFTAYTKPHVLEGQNVLITINKQDIDLNTITEKFVKAVETVVETKEATNVPSETKAEKRAREKAAMASVQLNKPDIEDSKALKLSDKQADELIDANEISEVERIVPKEVSVEVRKDLRHLLQSVSSTKTPWGYVGNKVLKLYYQAGKGTGFHEAFHAVFRFAINDVDVNRYLKLAEKEVLASLNTQDKLNDAIADLRASDANYAELTSKQIYELLLEEHMADRYMEYTQSESSVRTSTGLKQLFRRLKNLVKHLVGINDTLETFFDKIDRGAFHTTKAVANKQTFVTTKAYKNLPSSVDGFMTSSKSKKIINTFAAKVKQESRKDVTKNSDDIIEVLIQNRITNLETKGYAYVDGLTDLEKQANLELAIEEELFSLVNLEAKKLLVEQINKRLDLFDSRTIEEEENEEGENNEKGGDGFGSKEAWTISLEEGTNKVIREYIAFAMYEVIDELTNEPVLISVDNQTIYNGLAHVLANTPEDKMMNKFIKYAKNNKQANAVLDMIMSDTGMSYDASGLISSPTKNFNDLRRIITAFKNVKVEFTHTEFNPEFNAESGLLDKNEPRVYNANKNTPEKISFSKWANSLLNINNKQDVNDANRKDFWTAKIANVKKTFKSENFEDIKKEFEAIGIDFSLGYIEYSVYANKPIEKLTKEESSYLAAWDDITPINIDQFEIGEYSFKNILILNKNPYDTGKEGMSSKLEALAKSNGEFDESIQASNFKGADGNTRYDIIKGSYVLDEIIKLRNEGYRNKLIKKYPILKDNLLLKNKKLLNALKVKLISGVRDSSSDSEGQAYGDYSEREYIYQHLGYWFAQKKGIVNTLFRQNEASNTAYVAELSVDSYINENGKIDDKAINHIYSFFNSEFERMKESFKIGVIPDGINSIKGYNDSLKGRAFRLTEFSSLINIIGPAKYKEIVEQAQVNQPLSEDLIKEIKQALSKNLTTQIKEFKKVLQDGGFAKFDKDGNITTNDLLPTHLNEKKLSYKDINTQLSEMYINNYINSFSLNQLFDGDYAISRDDKGGIEKKLSLIDGKLVEDDVNGVSIVVPKVDIGIDIVKRHKGAMGSGSDLGNGTHKVAYIKDVNIFLTKTEKGLERTASGEKVNSNDAQSYTNINHIMFMTERLGRFSNDVKAILRKVRRGVEITSKEQETLEDSQASLNPWKTVTFGREFYVKTSEALLSRHEVSHISDMKKYNDIMDMIEKIEDASKTGLNKNDWSQLNEQLLKLYTPIKGKEYYHSLLNQMDIHGIDQIVAESASKGMTINPQDSTSADLDLSLSMVDIPNSYKRLQVETPTGKNVITAGTQLMQLIDSEQVDGTSVIVNGIPTTIGDVRREYRQSMANTRNNSFKLAEAYLKDGTDNANLKKKFIKALESSGADDQLLEIFEKNWNLLPAIDKAEQLFLSHFGGGILAQKVPGTKVALMSDAHWNVVVDKNDKVVLNKVVKLGGYDNSDTRKLYHNAVDPITKEIYSECILSEKVFSKFNLKIGDVIPVDVTTMLGYRIPTQDKHSMIALRVVDVLPNYLEGTGIFPAEIVHLSGADFDIDSLFIQQHSFTMIGGKPIKAGTEKTIEHKWEAFKTYIGKNKLIQSEINDRKSNNLLFKELSKINKKDRTKDDKALLNFTVDAITRDVLRYFTLPSTLSEYKNAKDSDLLNNDISNNQILDSELALLTNSGMKDIALTPVSSKPLEDEALYVQKIKGEEGKSVYSSSSLLGMFKANTQNSAGKSGIGPAANALQAFTLLAKNKLFRNSENSLTIDGVSLSSFSYLNSLGQRVADILSTVLSVMTDNAKDPIAGKMGLSLEILSAYNYMLSLGVSLRQATLIINTPSVQMYAKILKENKYSLKSREEKFKGTKAKIDELFNTISGNPKNTKIDVGQIKEDYINSEIITGGLENLIKEGINDSNRELNIQMLVKFMQIEEEASIFRDLNNIIKLTKGLPTSFSDVDNGLIESLYNLGLDGKFKLPARDEQIRPIVDVLNAIDNDPLLKKNIDSALQIIKYAEDVFISETKPFKYQFEKLITNLSSRIKKDSIKELKRSFLGFISTNAYVKLRQAKFADFNVTNDGLLYPELNETTLAKKLIILQNSKNDKIRNNKLIQWLKPELKFNEEEELNEKTHVFDKVSGKSFIKLSQESINDLVNSFQDLYTDKETYQFSIDLFHYLITKDNLEYKNDSFIKYISPFMFNNLSIALNEELKGLNNGELSAELNSQAKEFRMILASYKPTQEAFVHLVKGKDVGITTVDSPAIIFNQKSNRSMFENKVFTGENARTEYKFPEFILLKVGSSTKVYYSDLKGHTENWNTEAKYVEVKSAGYKAVSPFSKATYADFIRTYEIIEAAKKTRKAKLREAKSLIEGVEETDFLDNDTIMPDFESEGNPELNALFEANPFGEVDNELNVNNNLENSDKKVILFKNETTNSGVKISELYDETTWNSFEQIKKDYIKKCN